MGYDPIEVNQAASEAARAIRKNGGAGYVEPAKILTYDGNKNGKVVIAEQFVKVSAKPENLNSVTHINAFIVGTEKEYEKNALSIVTNGDMHYLTPIGDNFPIVISVSAETVLGEGENGIDVILPVGTYIYDIGNGSYATEVKFAETIHPIDPKFIPAFDSITLNGADGKQYKLSVDESGTLVHTAIEGA